MSDQQLQRQEALELITPVVDGEVNEDESRAFFQYVAHDREIRKQFEQERWIKHLVKNHLPRHDAPEHLRKQVYYWLQFEAHTEDKSNPPAGNRVSDEPMAMNSDTSKNSSLLKRWLSSRWIASLFFAGIGLTFIVGLIILSNWTGAFEVNKLAYRHYTLQRGALVTQETSLSTTKNPLPFSNQKGLQIPEFNGADFKKVLPYHFLDDYFTPLVIHRLENSNKHIYTFIFEVQKIQQNPRLFRSPEAITAIHQTGEPFIRNIDGGYVQSWQQGKYWYTSISSKKRERMDSIQGITKN